MSLKLKVLAVASSPEVQATLKTQLAGLDFVQCDGVYAELADVVNACKSHPPDVILADLTGRELDGGLFIEAMSMSTESPYVIFALHQEMDQQLLVDAVRRGAKEFIQYPADPEALNGALKRMLVILSRVKNASQPTPEKTTSKGRLISMFGPKGGSGASTMAVNLAHELYQMTDEPVVLFDLDQVFNNTAVLLNLRPSFSLGDLTENRVQEIDSQLMQRIVVEDPSGLHLVVGSKNVLDDHEMVSPELLTKVTDYLQETYRYVVVDLPTHVLDPYHQFMVERSDEVLVVSSIDIPSLYRTRQYLDLAKEYLGEDKLKLILNRFNLKAAYGISNKNLMEEFQYPIYAQLSNDWELCVEANSLGTVLSKVNSTSQLVKDIQTMAQKLVGSESTDIPISAKSSGNLFGKLFGKNREEAGHVARQA